MPRIARCRAAIAGRRPQVQSATGLGWTQVPLSAAGLPLFETAKWEAEVIEHFKHCAWLHGNGTIEDVSGAPIPRECAVYAFRQFEQWIYIGSASRGARSRLRSYRRNQAANATQLKHAELREYLQRGPLEFWVMPIGERLRMIDGMPIDWLLGVESGLIKTLHPVVNRRERVRHHES